MFSSWFCVSSLFLSFCGLIISFYFMLVFFFVFVNLLFVFDLWLLCKYVNLSYMCLLCIVVLWAQTHSKEKNLDVLTLLPHILWFWLSFFPSSCLSFCSSFCLLLLSPIVFFLFDLYSRLLKWLLSSFPVSVSPCFQYLHPISSYFFSI